MKTQQDRQNQKEAGTRKGGGEEKNSKMGPGCTPRGILGKNKGEIGAFGPE